MRQHVFERIETHEATRFFRGSIETVLGMNSNIRQALESGIGYSDVEFTGNTPTVRRNDLPLQQMPDKLYDFYSKVSSAGLLRRSESEIGDFHALRRPDNGKVAVKNLIVGSEITTRFVMSPLVEKLVVEEGSVDRAEGLLAASAEPNLDGSYSLFRIRRFDETENNGFETLAVRQRASATSFLLQHCEVKPGTLQDLKNSLRLAYSRSKANINITPRQLPGVNYVSGLNRPGFEDEQSVLGFDDWSRVLKHFTDQKKLKPNEVVSDANEVSREFSALVDKSIEVAYLNRIKTETTLALIALRDTINNKREVFADTDIANAVKQHTVQLIEDKVGVIARSADNVVESVDMFNRLDESLPGLITADYFDDQVLAFADSNPSLIALDFNTGMRAYELFGSYFITIIPSKQLPAYYWYRVDHISETTINQVKQIRAKQGKVIIAN
jgi:hypothetical protein